MLKTVEEMQAEWEAKAILDISEYSLRDYDLSVEDYHAMPHKAKVAIYQLINYSNDLYERLDAIQVWLNTSPETI